MKVNSNTVKLEKASYEELEKIIKKIASENKINNIKNVEIKLSKENGVVKFAQGHAPDEGSPYPYDVDEDLAEQRIQEVEDKKNLEEDVARQKRVRDYLLGRKPEKEKKRKEIQDKEEDLEGPERGLEPSDYK